MEEKISNKDIFSVLVKFAKSTEDRFDGIDRRLDGIDGRLDGIDIRLDRIDGRADGVDGRLSRIESQMVTKSYLDDKLADLRGDLVQMVDRKIAIACP
ncbi:hypothetical protein HOI83_01465 [Candidatus Uhrbacteria bacterium]|jgi:hypothetical protein|nr:hypothetical protein [Candidatus Uhrbacteria bacterium]